MKSRKNPLTQPSGKAEPLFFFVRSKNQYVQIRYKDILYAKSRRGGVCQIVTTAGSYIVCNSLKLVETYLPQNQFARIHQSYVVAIDRIKAFDKTWLKLHEHPESLKGFATITKFPVGGMFYQPMRKHLLVVSTRPSGYKAKTKTQREDDLEELEMVVD